MLPLFHAVVKFCSTNRLYKDFIRTIRFKIILLIRIFFLHESVTLGIEFWYKAIGRGRVFHPYQRTSWKSFKVRRTVSQGKKGKILVEIINGIIVVSQCHNAVDVKNLIKSNLLFQ